MSAMPTTRTMYPRISPAVAMPRPPSPVRRTCPRAIWPEMIARIASGPSANATIPHTIDTIASGLVC